MFNFGFETIILLFATLSLVGIGYSVFYAGRKKLKNIVMALFALSVGLWCFGIAMYIAIPDPAHSAKKMWLQIYYVAPVFIAMCNFMFSLAITNYKKRMSSVDISLLSIFTIICSILAYQVLFNGSFIVDKIISTYNVEINRGGYLLYSLVFLTVFVTSILKIIFYFYHSTKERNGFKYYIIGLAIASVCGVFFNLIMPWIGNYRLIAYGPLISILIPISIAYSIAKYNFFDIKTSVFRAVGYTFSLLAVSFISSFTIIRIILPFTGQDAEVKPVVYLISFVSLIFISWAVPRFRKFFDKFTYPIFYRNNYNPTLFAEHMAEAVTSNPQTTDLQRSILKLFNKAYGAQYIQIVVNRVEDEDPHHTNLIIGENLGHGAPAEVLSFYNKLFFGYEQKHKYVLRAKLDFEENSEESNLLSNNNIGMITKLKLNKRLVGYIIFGEKTSGTLYTLEDVDLVKNHYSEIAVALQNAVRYNRIKQFNLELQEKVDVATAKLKKSNARLRKLDKAKDDFLSIASHQLRTPLTVVRGNISLVAEGTMGKVSPQAHDILVQSERSAGRLADLINDFLSTSRLKTGKFILDPAPMDLGESVEEEYERLKDFAAMRGVELIMHEIPADLPEVMADASKIRQVLLNTIDNAIYYSPRRSGKVEIMVYSDGNSVIYKVKDNGIGVPAREKHKMFTRMYRAENAKGVRPDGNGLGLFLMKKIIDAHNGTIIFESKEGVGSTFGFKIDINPKVPLERSVIT